MPPEFAEEMLDKIARITTVKHKKMTYTTGTELYGEFWGIAA